MDTEINLPPSIQPVILCGGSGTRLWPLSRAGFPKQFLCLTGEESLFQQAARRLAAFSQQGTNPRAPLVVGNEEHRFLMMEQLREVGIDPGLVLLEPIGRNTAPALAMAALAALATGEDPLLVVTPADQAIADQEAFISALNHAVQEAARDAIVILGIAPDRPETGYGYIKVRSIPTLKLQPPALRVDAFIEKPNVVAAQRYLDEGGYYWNAGVFVLRASVWMSALERFRPDIARIARIAWELRGADQKFIRPGKAEFASIPAESIDHAVMEHCPGSDFPLKMVPLAAAWSDLGTWDAVWQALPKDALGNAKLGDVVITDSRNTLVHAASRLVSVVGVDDLVVVETADAVLVVERSRCQNIRTVIADLNASGREEHLLHRKVHRPWGWYDTVDEGSRFKVKRIQLAPKASLSLQKHHHRAEHWIVVKGTAEVTCGDRVVLLTENQSIHIPVGECHRLVNPGSIALEIIEVQSGSYLGEDDIVRIEDNYSRIG